MATMDPMGLVMAMLPQAQQSFQNSMRSAKRSFNNTEGNFWQKLGAGAMGYLDEVFTGDLAMDEQLDAEQRAKDEYDRQFAMQNAEYDRRVADERAYNDPSAQAERLKQAGINPMSTLGSMSPASNTAGDPGQPSANIPFESGMSDLVAMIEAQNQTRLISSQVNLNDANAEAVKDRNAREGELHIENLVGARLANKLSQVNLSNVIQQAPYLLAELKSEVEYREELIANAKRDGVLKDDQHRKYIEEIKNLQETRGLILAQKAFAESGVELNGAQKAFLEQQQQTEQWRTLSAEQDFYQARDKATDLYNTLEANIKNGYYDKLGEANVSELSKIIESNARKFWDKPSEDDDWWYFWNFLWNIQNCLTLSGSISNKK